MYARVASFENRDPSLTDDLVSAVRDRVSRSREELPDSRGALVLVDREANTSMGITFFESEDAIRRSEPVFERMGDDFPEELRGRRASVDTYEVAFADGGERAEAARVSILEGPVDRLDENVDEVLPQVRQIQGCTGALGLVDRNQGRMKVITFWESSEALRSSEEQANQLRQRAAEGASARIVDVKRFEVAVAQDVAQVAAR